jgi:hypothetical protein
MSEGIKEQLLSKMCNSYKKSTDVAGLPLLLVFVRYCFGENIHEVFMFCPPLTARTTESDIFKAVSECIISEDILWSDYVLVFMDGAAALTGHKKCFEAEGRQIASYIHFMHFIIRREVLASCDL